MMLGARLNIGYFPSAKAHNQSHQPHDHAAQNILIHRWPQRSVPACWQPRPGCRRGRQAAGTSTTAVGCLLCGTSWQLARLGQMRLSLPRPSSLQTSRRRGWLAGRQGTRLTAPSRQSGCVGPAWTGHLRSEGERRCQKQRGLRLRAGIYGHARGGWSRLPRVRHSRRAGEDEDAAAAAE